MSFRTPHGTTRAFVAFINHRRRGRIEIYEPSHHYLEHVKRIKLEELKVIQRTERRLAYMRRPQGVCLKFMSSILNPALDDYWFDHEPPVVRIRPRLDGNTAKFN